MSNLSSVFPDLVTRMADGREFRTKRSRSIYDTDMNSAKGNLPAETDLDIADEKLDYLNELGPDLADDAYTPYLDSEDSYTRDYGTNGHDKALLLDTIGSDGLRLMEPMNGGGSGVEYDKSVETLLNSADTQEKMDNLQKAMNNYNIIRLK